jgi:hypothetical protein
LEDTKVDKLFFIKLYNILTGYYKDVEYLNDKNRDEFKILNDYGLEDYNKLKKSDEGYYYESFYKIKGSNVVEFYYIRYSFICNKFIVETKLLYRLKV